MAGGDRFFLLEIIIHEQQAIAAVIGDQQGAVIGAGQLAQVAPQLCLFEPLAAIALKQGDRAGTLVGGDEARGLPLVIGNHGGAHLPGRGGPQQQGGQHQG